MDGPPSRDSAPVLDPGALDQLRALQRPGRPSIVERVIHLFNDDAPKQCTSMRNATKNGDQDSLRRAAHTLKSSAANVGATELRALCEAIESDARQGRIEAALVNVEKLDAVLKPVLEALNQEVRD